MASDFINISVDVEEAQEALSGTSKSLKSIQKNVLRVIAKGSLKAVKSALQSSNLDLSHTGELKSAYRYKIKKDGTQANIFPVGKNGKNIFSKAQALSFGRGANTKHGELIGRGFVQAGIRNAEGDHSKEVQEIINKELQKYWG